MKCGQIWCSFNILLFYSSSMPTESTNLTQPWKYRDWPSAIELHLTEKTPTRSGARWHHTDWHLKLVASKSTWAPNHFQNQCWLLQCLRPARENQCWQHFRQPYKEHQRTILCKCLGDDQDRKRVVNEHGLDWKISHQFLYPGSYYQIAVTDPGLPVLEPLQDFWNGLVVNTIALDHPDVGREQLVSSPIAEIWMLAPFWS